MNKILSLFWAVGRRPAVALAILAVVLLVLWLQTDQRAHRPQGYDLTSYLLSARALESGENPYQTGSHFPYIYPLFFAFAMIPLASLPCELANFLWFALGAASLAAGCLTLVRLASDELKTTVGWHLAWPCLALFLVLLLPIQSNLLNGQVNLLVVFCCILFLREFMHDHDVPAAVWLAAAIAIKLLPAVLLLFVVMRRRWRVLSWTCAAAVVFCLLPGLVVGKNLFALYEHYFHAFLMPSFLDPGPHDDRMFFGLRGTILYLLPGAATSLWPKLLGLLTALGVMLTVDVASKSSERPQRDVWPFCAYLLGSLLASPAAEMHHLMFAAPAVALVGLKLCFDRDWATPAVWLGAGAFLTCFCVLGNSYSTTPTYFASLIVLAILLLRAARPSRPVAAERFQPHPCNAESA
ncbi:MAG: glycosyltransferase family 87 protein [Thermoguttaceae bacterium]